ncbi:MAG: DUF4333 domain-containing protein [Acidimicrobiales bacterium]
MGSSHSPRRLALAVFGGMAIALSACGSDRLDDELLLQAIPEAVLPDQPDLLEGLACPSPIEIGEGVTAHCTARIGGVSVNIEIEQTNAEGGVIATLAETLFDVVETSAKLGDRFEAELGVPTTVECGEPPLRVLEVGMKLTCTAADIERSREIVLEVTDEQGNYSLELGAFN